MKKFAVFYANDPMDGLHHLMSDPTEVDMELFSEVYYGDFDDLADVFRKMNVVDGNELPTVLGVRSMCTGDLVQDVETGKYWYCKFVGWCEVKVVEGSR
jgi:hypothetical protein